MTETAENLETTATENTEADGAVDMTGVQTAERALPASHDPLERQERERAKATATPAPAGAYVVTCNLRIDGKKFQRGDVFEGKLYHGLVENGTIVPSETWDAR